MKIYKYIGNSIIFLLLASLPIVFNFWLINSQGEEVKRRVFIEEKISIVYSELSDSTPTISVVDKPKVIHLKRDIELRKGDLIYYYRDQGVAVLVDGGSEDVLGIVTQRNL